MHHHLYLPPFDDMLIADITALSEQVFERADPDHIRWRLTRMPEVSVFTVAEAGALIAFKAGYAMSAVKYYSWLGGVHPDYRRRGLASELMTRQHRWLQQHGYTLVETASNQDNRAMAQVNLRHGFSVCGMRNYREAIQVLFLKSLGVNDDEP